MLRATWMPSWMRPVTGLNMHLGEFWINWADDREERRGSVRIDITIPAAEHRRTRYDYLGGYFASLRFHHDGIDIIRELDRNGFLNHFQESKVCTFYGVLFCIQNSEMAFTSHDEDKQLLSREMYELLI